MIELINNAHKFQNRIAIKSNGKCYTYNELLTKSKQVALALLGQQKDLKEARIAFLVDPEFDYVAIQWGIWRGGGIAVPLCTKHPLSSIKYVLEDTNAIAVVAGDNYLEFLEPLHSLPNIKFIKVSDLENGKTGPLPVVKLDRRAMILYTSGTTALPKGVVTTHYNIQTQIISLVESWKWSKSDHILNILPLHHVHGIVNILCCALWSGAVCEFLPKFSESKVFEIFLKKEVNVFMAVPTIYFKLISYWEKLPEVEQLAISTSLKEFRLMVSGSAALPISVLERWNKISGHTLLERYGMTEIGMAISNPYDGERRPGYIGQALPGVSIRLVGDKNVEVEEGIQGEIQIKGDNVFKEYWNKPRAVRDAFTEDGWFKSGDIAIYENGSYRILGRDSVDIIKSGGYKISALEIEEVLRKHPKIKECGVVGIPDEEWGEIICASLVLTDTNYDIAIIKEWLKDKLPNYKMPRKYICQDDLPRNVMGKVTKNELKKLF